MTQKSSEERAAEEASRLLGLALSCGDREDWLDLQQEIRLAILSARRAALEEAARVADVLRVGTDNYPDGTKESVYSADIAAAIRALSSD